MIRKYNEEQAKKERIAREAEKQAMLKCSVNVDEKYKNIKLKPDPNMNNIKTPSDFVVLMSSMESDLSKIDSIFVDCLDVAVAQQRCAVKEKKTIKTLEKVYCISGNKNIMEIEDNVVLEDLGGNKRKTVGEARFLYHLNTETGEKAPLNKISIRDGKTIEKIKQ